MSANELTPVFSGEMQLAGWSESHNGGCKVVFWLAEASDLDAFRALTVRKGNQAGQRLAAVLVEIGDDEHPVVQPAPQPAEKPKGGALARLAGMWCADPLFREWASKRAGCAIATDTDAAEFIREECGVMSRIFLDSDKAAADRFHQRIRGPFVKYMAAAGVPA